MEWGKPHGLWGVVRLNAGVLVILYANLSTALTSKESNVRRMCIEGLL